MGKRWKDESDKPAPLRTCIPTHKYASYDDSPFSKLSFLRRNPPYSAAAHSTKVKVEFWRELLRLDSHVFLGDKGSLLTEGKNWMKKNGSSSLWLDRFKFHNQAKGWKLVSVLKLLLLNKQTIFLCFYVLLLHSYLIYYAKWKCFLKS